MQEALDSIPALGSDPGVGAKSNSCLLCHATASGGPENINASFGNDFRTVARDLLYAADGASLPATGSPSLAEIFSNGTFQGLDSDDDGNSNGAEFQDNTDPAGDITGDSGGSSSGGCGMISGGGPPPGGGPWFMLLPFMLLIFLKPLRFSRA